MALQHPDFCGCGGAGAELLAKGWLQAAGGKRTPRKADKPGSVKVREAFGEPSSCQLCSVLPGFSRSLLCLHDSCMVISPRSKLIDCE